MINERVDRRRDRSMKDFTKKNRNSSVDNLVEKQMVFALTNEPKRDNNVRFDYWNESEQIADEHL